METCYRLIAGIDQSIRWAEQALWEGVRGRRCGRHRRRRPEAHGPGARGGARRAIARRREGVPSGT